MLRKPHPILGDLQQFSRSEYPTCSLVSIILVYTIGDENKVAKIIILASNQS